MSVNYNTVTWLQYTLDNVFNPGHDIKKYILFKHNNCSDDNLCGSMLSSETIKQKYLFCDLCLR